MPLGNSGQVTVNVGAKLQVLQSSVNEIQKVLDKLQPNSSRFKELNNIVTQIRKEMDRLQIQTSKPFGSQQQFNQAAKTIDHIEESLDRAQLAIDRIDFKDLKLDSAQQAQFDELVGKIKEAERAFDNFKNSQKTELFKDANFKKFADSIDPSLINKNFDQVVDAVKAKSDQITKDYEGARKKLERTTAQIQVATNVKNFLGNKGLNEKSIGDKFTEFFTKTADGLKFKSNQKEPFFEWLKEQFSVTDGQIEELKKLSANKIQEKLLNDPDFFAPQMKKGAAALNRQVNERTDVTLKANAVEQARQANEALVRSEEQVAAQEAKTSQEIAKGEAELRKYGEGCAAAAKGLHEGEGGVDSFSQSLQGLRESLNQTNAEFLRLQRQTQTFNSIKSAIVNFMGFNQVLNITRNAVRAAINHIKELDTTMNGIAIVTDMTTADLWKQVDAYSSMAQNFGVTIQGAYEVSKIYYQAGYETNDVLTLTNETLKLSKISGLDYATTTDYMMTAMRGFKLEMEDASRVVDVYSNLAANTAVSQQELAEAMTRTASSMESVGATFEETSAMIATMVAVTRESANNIGSAMKSIASRYGELTKDPTALLDADGEAMSFNKVDTALKSVGITLQTTDHQFRKFSDVILELAERWDTLDSAQQRYIATQFARLTVLANLNSLNCGDAR